MKRRRPPTPPPWQLLAESLSCPDPTWHAISGVVPTDSVPTAWLAWPGRQMWLEQYEAWRRQRITWPSAGAAGSGALGPRRVP